jgi:hypothetical protein
MILQKLSSFGKINWKKHKTNRQYLSEIKGSEDLNTMRTLTILYERAWFGEHVMDEQEYELVSPLFVNYLQNIR